ncbi:hypothetical protein [Rhodopila sp.]|jgi:hypothetical protein|uniref:hypothetical protein n=1 Tax=Rhodopila sp. TaxID=2480087 RepID=UPI002CA7DA5F|nr:hypothetical protein [Rhodopila sp.]HVZ09831.1 hypothetical protein [Rhodopila sp.]
MKFAGLAGGLLSLSLSLGLLAGCAVPAASPYPPVPALLPDPVAPPPLTSEQMIWQPGHWNWTGSGYVWAPGQWVLAAGHGQLWMPGWWQQTGSGWAWQPAHWTAGG